MSGKADEARDAFNKFQAPSLKLPEKLEQPGLLLGWSLEYERKRIPIGFSMGDPKLNPETGYIDPYLMSNEGHLITIAPTGAGKGRSCIIPALLRHEGPVIVVDPKGENVTVTARRRRELGQDVIVLDPMGITNQANGCFNPMELIEADSVEAVDLVSSFASALVDGREDPRNTYWYQRAQFLLTCVILHVATLEDKSRRHFGTVREMLGGLSSSIVQDEKGMAKLVGVGAELVESPHPEARAARSLLLGANQEGLHSILSMAQNAVDFLRGPRVSESVSKTDFPIDAVTRGDPLSIYLVLPPHMLESHGRLLRLWIMSLLALITRRRGRPQKSTLLILDEAAQLGSLPQLRQAITLLRGYGVQTWSFWQDPSQISHLYPHDWQTMVNNCSVVQCFGALNLNSATTVAQLTGHGDGHEVLGLNAYEMVLQIGGCKSVIARKPDYLLDPPFQGQFDVNPYHNKAQPIVPPPAPRIKLVRAEKTIVQPERPLATVTKLHDVPRQSTTQPQRREPEPVEVDDLLERLKRRRKA